MLQYFSQRPSFGRAPVAGSSAGSLSLAVTSASHCLAVNGWDVPPLVGRPKAAAAASPSSLVPSASVPSRVGNPRAAELEAQGAHPAPVAALIRKVDADDHLQIAAIRARIKCVGDAVPSILRRVQGHNADSVVSQHRKAAVADHERIGRPGIGDNRLSGQVLAGGNERAPLGLVERKLEVARARKLAAKGQGAAGRQGKARQEVGGLRVRPEVRVLDRLWVLEQVPVRPARGP